MSLNASILEAMTSYVRKHNDTNVKVVTSYEQDTRTGGYCETCYYEETVVRMQYLDCDNAEQECTYSGYLSEFIRELTDM